MTACWTVVFVSVSVFTNEFTTLFTIYSWTANFQKHAAQKGNSRKPNKGFLLLLQTVPRRGQSAKTALTISLLFCHHFVNNKKTHWILLICVWVQSCLTVALPDPTWWSFLLLSGQVKTSFDKIIVHWRCLTFFAGTGKRAKLLWKRKTVLWSKSARKRH